MIPTFQTTFQVPLSCEGCVKSVSDSLFKLEGIQKVEGDVPNQLISVEGTAAPSAIVDAIQSTGKDAILRGSGKADSAAVCILETFSSTAVDKVKGLIRMVQVASNMTIVDLGIRGLQPGTYHATVRTAGDISSGPESTGSIWNPTDATSSTQTDREGGVISASVPRGAWGTVEVSKTGVGSVFWDKPIQVWELIGRSIVVAKQRDGPFSQHDENTLVGVIARSAGVWENDKTVCSCSGKTVWEERTEQVGKGML